jgi:hypothetical protein
LKFQEGVKPQALKLFWKMATKVWRQFRFELRRDFVRKRTCKSHAHFKKNCKQGFHILQEINLNDVHIINSIASTLYVLSGGPIKIN